MKKRFGTDLTIIIGLFAGIGLMAYGVTDGGELSNFISYSSMAITFGGTIAATFMTMEEYEKNLLEIKPVSTISLNQMVLDSSTMEEKHTEVSSGPQDDPAEILSTQEFSEVLIQGIKKLNQEQQLVLALFYKEDLTVKEIAEIMNTNTQRVSQVRFQAVKRLKKLAENKTGFDVL